MNVAGTRVWPSLAHPVRFEALGLYRITAQPLLVADGVLKLRKGTHCCFNIAQLPCITLAQACHPSAMSERGSETSHSWLGGGVSSALRGPKTLIRRPPAPYPQPSASRLTCLGFKARQRRRESPLPSDGRVEQLPALCKQECELHICACQCTCSSMTASERECLPARARDGEVDRSRTACCQK